MLHRPRFKPHLRVEVVPGEGVFLISEQEQSVLQGRLYELVASCLDGGPAEDLCGRLRDQASAAEIYYTVDRLEQKGYLAEGGDAPCRREKRPSGRSRESIPRRRRDGWLRRRSRSASSATWTPGRSGSCCIRCTSAWRARGADGGAHRRLLAEAIWKRHNQEALAAGRPWLLAKPVGAQVWLGPLFVPGKTGCWECLAERLRANSPVASYLERAGTSASGRSAVDRCHTPATLQVA